MRTTLRHVAVATILVLGAGMGRAAAQGVTDKGASVIMFPKVIADGTRDTVIQIVNTSNLPTGVRCFYDNAAPANPGPPDPHNNPPQWIQTDFILQATAQQPVHWVASAGRTANPIDPTDPGAVPPVSSLPFTGELVCVQLASDNTPLSGNSLIGEAEIKDRSSGDVAKYSAYGLRGIGANNGDNILVSDGIEYEACPKTVVLEDMTEGAADQLAGAGSSVHTDITVIACAHDFATSTPLAVTLQFEVFNEFESKLTASTTVTGWATIPLQQITNVFRQAVLGTDFAQARITPRAGSGAAVVVAQEFHTSGVATASLGANTHVDGAAASADLIVLPVQ